MKILMLLIFISTNSYANSFRLSTTTSRFELHISKTELKYKSELVERSLLVNKCNQNIIFKFNGEMLQAKPDSQVKHALDYSIDKRQFKVSPQSSFGQKLLSMDQKILQFFEHVRQKCK